MHIVILLHGIRTRAEWADMVRDVLVNSGCVDQAIPIGYGYFSSVKFLCPFLTREAPVQRLVQEYRDLKLRYGDCKISIIAHSFGTYIVSEALKEPDVSFFRIIFCGSVVSPSFRPARHLSQVIAPGDKYSVLNDYGCLDVWPVFAASASWGFGPSGTFGFKQGGIFDRANLYGHSMYFTVEHVQNVWVPYLESGEIVASTLSREAQRTPPWITRLAALPFKFLVALVLVAAAVFFYLSPFKKSKISIHIPKNATLRMVIEAIAKEEDATLRLNHCDSRQLDVPLREGDVQGESMEQIFKKLKHRAASPVEYDVTFHQGNKVYEIFCK